MKRFGMVAAALLLLARPSAASSITYFDTVYNTDYATSAIGLRHVSTGDITVSGVSGTVTRAYLYWHGLTNTSDPTINQNITFAGNQIQGTNLGLSSGNEWYISDANPNLGVYPSSQAYRADVTQYVTGNGAYNLAGLLNTLNVGEENGASLWVFFDDGNAANNRDVVLFNGNASNWDTAIDPAGWDFTLNGINYTGGNAYLRTFVSDGQTFADPALRINGDVFVPDGQDFFNGSDPAAPGAFNLNGSLVDVDSFDITSKLSIGINNIRIQGDTLTSSVNGTDYLNMIVAGVDLPAGAVPAVPEPGTMVLVGFGLAAFRKYRRS